MSGIQKPMELDDSSENVVWQCSVCTYENQEGSKVCEVCNTAKSGSSDWKCTECTFMNNASRLTCEMCGTVSPQLPTSSEDIACPKCTFVNPRSNRNCGMCNSSLGTSPSPKPKKTRRRKIKQHRDNEERPPPLERIDTDHRRAHANHYFPQDEREREFLEIDHNGSDEDIIIANNEIIPNNPFQNPFPDAWNTVNAFGGNPPPPQPIVAPHESSNNFLGGMFAAVGSMFSRHEDPNAPRDRRSSRSRKGKKRHSDRHRHGNRHGHRNGRKNHQKARGGNEVMFKDVAEILNKEANEKDRIHREEKEIKELYEMYEHVFFVMRDNKRNEPSPDKMRVYLTRMMKYIPESTLQEDQLDDSDMKHNCRQCQICYCDFENDAVTTGTCGHRMICEGCFAQYLKTKIKDEDITPWLSCPAPDCRVNLEPNLLFQALNPEMLYTFASIFLRKHMARNPNWIPCKNGKKCGFGFVMFNHEKDKTLKERCKACGTKQEVSRNPMKSDAGFQDLVKSGILRLCPKCSLPTMKDKGMCNVMQCGKCGIWWNWRTRETGTSSRELKQRARMHGTLWEPGELRYQQQLQRSDPEAFKLLLERNGIKYDPNYVRGT